MPLASLLRIDTKVTPDLDPPPDERHLVLGQRGWQAPSSST